MRLRHFYLGLCVLGIVVPYLELIPWLTQHGLDMEQFMRELFATRIGAFFAFDVVVSALAFFVFVFAEQRVARVRHVWLPVVLLLWLAYHSDYPYFFTSGNVL